MDSVKTLQDKDSSNTVILWKNEIPPNKCIPILENLHQYGGHLYKGPTGMNEHFSNSVIQTTEDFVNEVIAVSERAVRYYLQTNK